MHSEHDSTSQAAGREGADAAEAPRPLGFWLKTVDRLISREFAAAFDDLDVTRREWRLLNLIAGDVRDDRLTAKLAARPHLVEPLVDRGWVAQVDGDWRITDEGRDALQALGERVSGIRSRVAGAVPPEDYDTTTATLEAIARELGWDERAERSRWAERRHGHRGRDHDHDHDLDQHHGRGPHGRGPHGRRHCAHAH